MFAKLVAEGTGINHPAIQLAANINRFNEVGFNMSINVNEPIIMTVDGLLQQDLVIPPYQRAYKWTTKNIDDLFDDISIAISNTQNNKDFRYRIGTIILHKDAQGYNIVDGQQRIISLTLLKLALDDTFTCGIIRKDYSGDKISQKNIHENYNLIKQRLVSGEIDIELIEKALSEAIEVVVICVDDVNEAFQLFDSQNTRGKALEPHDLLKAYHLREMKAYPYEMRQAVTKWEVVNSQKISELFSLYLFPIRRWSKGKKSYPFSASDIDEYKGIEEASPYTYAKRANKATPHFQITEPYVAGNDFFEMVSHYLNMLAYIKAEIRNPENFKKIYSILKWNEDADGNETKSWAGFRYVKNLFYCAVFHYYDRFKNLDKQAIIKLFSWAFMIRVDMENLGFDTINKYAISDKENSRYTNQIPMFYLIDNARRHNEISNIKIDFRKEGMAESKNWNDLYDEIRELNGYGK